MHCNNCGTPITGKEIKCPGCGMSIKNQLAKKQQLSNTMKIPVTKENTPNKKTIKKPNKKIGFILFILGLVLIGLALIINMLPKEAKKEKKEETNIIDNNSMYKGYQFIIPDAYTFEKSDKYGVLIKGKDIIYTLDIDFNNSYQNYKTDFEKFYREMAKDETRLNNLYQKSLEREYLIDPIITGEYQSAMYATESDKYTTFTGLIVKKDYSKVETKDLEELTKIIEKIKLIEVPKELEEDNNNLKIYGFTKEDFEFK